MKYNLNERAIELFKDNQSLQQKWIAAVEYLRTSKRGWVLDSSGVVLTK